MSLYYEDRGYLKPSAEPGSRVEGNLVRDRRGVEVTNVRDLVEFIGPADQDYWKDVHIYKFLVPVNGLNTKEIERGILLRPDPYSLGQCKLFLALTR